MMMKKNDVVIAKAPEQLLEIYSSKTSEEPLEIKDRLIKEQVIYNRLNKTSDELVNTLALVDALIERAIMSEDGDVVGGHVIG